MKTADLRKAIVEGGSDLDARVLDDLLLVLTNLVYVYDLEKKCYVFISGDSTGILGYAAEELFAMGEAVTERLVHPDDLKRVTDHFRECEESVTGDRLEIEYRVKHTIGDWHWLSVCDTPLFRKKDDKPRYLLGVAEDISQRRAAQEKVWFVSTHDELTGLFNRAYFEAEVGRMEKSRRYPISVLYVDIVGLRSVNENHGQEVGDEMLRRTGQVLMSAFRAEDVIARLGGDEFAVILPNTGSVSTEAILTRVKTHLQNHNQTHRQVPLNLTLGIATVDYGQSLRDAVRNAEKRLYDAKLSSGS